MSRHSVTSLASRMLLGVFLYWTGYFAFAALIGRKDEIFFSFDRLISSFVALSIGIPIILLYDKFSHYRK